MARDEPGSGQQPPLRPQTQVWVKQVDVVHEQTPMQISQVLHGPTSSGGVAVHVSL